MFKEIMLRVQIQPRTGTREKSSSRFKKEPDNSKTEKYTF